MVVPQSRRGFLALIRNAAVAAGLVAASPTSTFAAGNLLPILEIENGKFINAKKLLDNVQFSDWVESKHHNHIEKERKKTITVWLDKPFKMWLHAQFANISGQVELRQDEIKTSYKKQKSSWTNIYLTVTIESTIKFEENFNHYIESSE